MAFLSLILALSISMAVLLLSPASGQITTPCTPSMMTTFTPCMNFVTNSSLNGTPPTIDCCNSLKSLMNNGKDCLCLIATASVPFQVPINRTLAISLPRACNVPGVPLQCKASGAPIPAPGPVADGPTLSPNAAPSPSVQADASPAPTTSSGAPTSNTVPTLTPPGMRPTLTPSAAQPSHSALPSLLVAVVGVILMKCY
ncbi:hypothetical protein Pfo_016068 [Paulownia fortunei]|nr:hypothetical protein Pfo_016068 [Paulownia fortunei]